MFDPNCRNIGNPDLIDRRSRRLVNVAKPLTATADTGYFSEQQVNDERIRHVDLYILTTSEATKVSLLTTGAAGWLTLYPDKITSPSLPMADKVTLSSSPVADKVRIRLRQWSGKQKHGEDQPPGVMEPGDLSAPSVEADAAKAKMNQRLKTEACQALYKPNPA